MTCLLKWITDSTSDFLPHWMFAVTQLNKPLYASRSFSVQETAVFLRVLHLKCLGQEEGKPAAYILLFLNKFCLFARQREREKKRDCKGERFYLPVHSVKWPNTARTQGQFKAWNWTRYPGLPHEKQTPTHLHLSSAASWARFAGSFFATGGAETPTAL